MEYKCSECGLEISEAAAYRQEDKVFCEDCYMDIMSTMKTCDPWAVSAAKNDRKSKGSSSSQGLTDIQKKICEYVKSKGRALPEDIADALKMDLAEFERQFAVLRHCELLKGEKVGNKVYIVLFSGSS